MRPAWNVGDIIECTYHSGLSLGMHVTKGRLYTVSVIDDNFTYINERDNGKIYSEEHKISFGYFHSRFKPYTPPSNEFEPYIPIRSDWGNVRVKFYRGGEWWNPKQMFERVEVTSFIENLKKQFPHWRDDENPHTSF